MPLHLTDGIEILVAPVLPPELWGHVLDTTIEVLPDENLGGIGSAHERLEVPWYHQKKDLWCWVACAQMVRRYFGTYLQQCEIAHRKLKKPCCKGTTPSYCNEDLTAEQIDGAFEKTGLKCKRDDVVSFTLIQKEVTPKGGPVVAGIQWTGKDTGGHLIVINGWKVVSGVRYLTVNDPIYGHGHIRYDDLINKYGPNDNGKWVCTWTGFSG